MRKWLSHLYIWPFIILGKVFLLVQGQSWLTGIQVSWKITTVSTVFSKMSYWVISSFTLLVSYSAHAAVTRHHWWVTKITDIFHSSGVCEVWEQSATWSVFWWRPSTGSQTVILLYPHMERVLETERKKEISCLLPSWGLHPHDII